MDGSKGAHLQEVLVPIPKDSSDMADAGEMEGKMMEEAGSVRCGTKQSQRRLAARSSEAGGWLLVSQREADPPGTWGVHLIDTGGYCL